VSSSSTRSPRLRSERGRLACALRLPALRHAALRLAALTLAAAGSLVPSTARADIALAGDLEFDAPADTDLDTAPAFGVRLSWQHHLPLLVFTPELGYHHAAFGDALTLNRALAGARLGIGEVFRIGAYGHIGVANAAYHSPGGGSSLTDITYDAGGFLDFTLLPLLDVGVHAGYARVRTDDRAPLKWVPIGVHAALVF